MKRRALALLAALAVVPTGCAMSHRATPEAAAPASLEEEAQLAADYQRRIQQLEVQLSAVGSSASTPTCESACPLIHNICELAGRICQIAQRHPDDAGHAEQCRDANARCGHARARIEPGCGCL